MRTAKRSYKTGSVQSADRTTIGYRTFGNGPALLLLHGGVNAAQHMMRLGELLQDSFTVYLPDRRGRGLSGPFGPDYTIKSEDDDLAALVEHTGAQLVFGPADGGLFALHGSIGLPHVTKVAAYDPLLMLGQPGIDQFTALFTTMQQQIQDGRLGEAVRYSAAETATMEARRGVYPSWIAAVLRHTPVALYDAYLRFERPKGDDVAWRDLLPPMAAEMELVKATEGTLEEYRELRADVLLMYGSKSHPVFENTATQLHRILPLSTLIRLPGLNHDAAQTYGHPEQIAAALRVFFTGN